MRDAEVRWLVEAMMKAIEASLEVEDARKKHEGYDFDYFHSSEISARDIAVEEFGKQLNEYIDQRIQSATGAKP